MNPSARWNFWELGAFVAVDNGMRVFEGILSSSFSNGAALVLCS
jgi:hypothetical protein